MTSGGPSAAGRMPDAVLLVLSSSVPGTAVQFGTSLSEVAPQLAVCWTVQQYACLSPFCLGLFLLLLHSVMFFFPRPLSLLFLILTQSFFEFPWY